MCVLKCTLSLVRFNNRTKPDILRTREVLSLWLGGLLGKCLCLLIVLTGSWQLLLGLLGAPGDTHTRLPVRNLPGGRLDCDGSHKCLWTEACGLLSSKDTKLRRRKEGGRKDHSKYIWRGSRQGASSKRANCRLAEYGSSMAEFGRSRSSPVISPPPSEKACP